ncbi:MAG: GNAT family N-acetyltransferase [Sulfurovaceae bacterium]
MNLFKRFLIFAQSGGMQEAISYSLNSFKNIFYTNSQTYFMYLHNDTQEDEAKPDNLDFVFLYSFDEIRKYKFDRLFAYPVEKWFNEGAVCQIGLLENEPISFLWIHKKDRKINRAMTVVLAENNYWIGPIFVHKKIRGKGINKAQLNFLLSNKNYKKSLFATCTNSENMASLGSFAKLGFELSVITRYKKIIFKNSKTDLIVFKNNIIKYHF